MAFQELIDLIRDGELVSAAIANRSPQQLDQNVRYLRDVIEAALLGETLFARNKVVEVDAKVGMAMYYDYVSQTWKRALGGVETVSETGQLKTTRASQVWGVIYQKLTSTSADILLAGTADIDLTEAVDDTIDEGAIYFLSNSAPGKLITTDQPVSVAVLQTAGLNADGSHKVLVNTSFQDLLTNHRHYKFVLQAVPAGTHVIPDFGEPHQITNPDSSIEGWLPADDAVFNGKAPTGAKWGYNLSVSGLNDLWPPIPTENAVLELVRGRPIQPIRKERLTWTGTETIAANGTFLKNIDSQIAREDDEVMIATNTLAGNEIIVSEATSVDQQVRLTFLNTSGAGPVDLTEYTLDVFYFSSSVENLTIGYVPVPDDLVVIDRNGIWWMSDCYNEVPWPTAFGLESSVSESVSVADCPTLLEMLLNLWFTKPIFQNTSTAVLSLQATASSGITIVCADTDDPASTGHLLLDLDLGLTFAGDDDAAGYLAFKTLDGNQISRGPVVESVTAGSNNMAITGDLKVGNKYYGNLVITVDNEVDNKELSVDTVRLDGVTEEFYEDTIALGFAAGQNSEFRGRIHIPLSLNIPAGTLMKLRFRVMSKSSTTLPQDLFSLAYRRVPSPTVLLAPVALPTADTALADQPTSDVAFSAVDMYFEFESETFAIVSGDTILFTLSRASIDSYGGDLLLLRQRGVLVDGS